MKVNLLEKEFQNLDSRGSSDSSSFSRRSQSMRAADVNGRLVSILKKKKKQKEISEKFRFNNDKLNLPKNNIAPVDGSNVTKFKPFTSQYEKVIKSKRLNYHDCSIYLQHTHSEKLVSK